MNHVHSRIETNIPFYLAHPVWTAIGLSMGPALSLGLGRFSYALFLPMMRADLHWSYFLAGAMNTGNAVGYLIGALTMSWLIKRFTAARVFVVGGLLGNLFIAFSGVFTDSVAFFVCRLCIGIANTYVFAGGSVLAAQLSNSHPRQSGWLMGIYYAGGGLGIMIPSFFVPALTDLGQQWQWFYAWQLAWFGLAAIGFLGLACMWFPGHSIPPVPPRENASDSTSVRRYARMVSGYVLFGVGYIGYMTFVIALLMQIGMVGMRLNIFYALLGLSAIASSKIWARTLDHYKGGQTLGILNLLLGIACMIPAVIATVTSPSDSGPGWIVIGMLYLSGMIFGSGLLTAVASTTIFVKHNLPQSQWVAGITVFTCLFAIGQVVGPTLIGWVADGSGGLARGLMVSAAILFVGSVTAWTQPSLSD